MKNLISRAALYAALAFCPCIVAPVFAMEAASTLSADIIMQKNKDGIAACGIGFKLNATQGRYAVNLVVEKESAGTVTKLFVSSDPNETLISATVRTLDFSTQKLLKKFEAPKKQLGYAQKLPPDTVGSLFQQLMVSGAKIEITTMSDTKSWSFPGPAPQSLRAMYLMCAGDMYRP